MCARGAKRRDRKSAARSPRDPHSARGGEDDLVRLRDRYRYGLVTVAHLRGELQAWQGVAGSFGERQVDLGEVLDECNVDLGEVGDECEETGMHGPNSPRGPSPLSTRECARVRAAAHQGSLSSLPPFLRFFRTPVASAKTSRRPKRWRSAKRSRRASVPARKSASAQVGHGRAKAHRSAPASLDLTVRANCPRRQTTAAHANGPPRRWAWVRARTRRRRRWSRVRARQSGGQGKLVSLLVSVRTGNGGYIGHFRA